MFTESTVIGLIGQIYEAAEDPALWQPFLGALAEAFRCRSAGMDFYDFANRRAGAGASIGISEDAWRKYVTYYGEKNVLWLQAAKEGLVAPCLIVDNRMLFDDSEYARTEYCADFLEKDLGVFHVIGGSIIKDHEVSSNLSLLRDKSLPFEDDERQLLRTLMPHIRRSLSLHRLLASAESASMLAAETIDQLPRGVVVLDERGNVTLMNSAARRMLAKRDGFVLAAGRLTSLLRAEAQQLERLISGAIATSSGTGSSPGGLMTVSRTSGRKPFVVMVTPLGRSDTRRADTSGAAGIFITDPEVRPANGAEALAAVHGLTPAEARLAMRLLDGMTIAEASEESGVTVDTGRTHLKHIFAKTNTRRQSELLLLLSATLRSVPQSSWGAE